MLDAIADPYAQTLRRAGVELEHGADRTRRGDGGLGLGLGAGGDAGDLAPCEPMNSMSSGMKVFFIHIAIGCSSPKSNSMPAWGSISLRNISPCARSSGVRASSIKKLWTVPSWL